MGVIKNKPKAKAKSTKKTLTKKQVVARRVSKVQKMLEYRKKLKKSHKNKVVPIKKKRQQEAEQ